MIKICEATRDNDFVIQNNELVEYKGHDSVVEIPEGVKRINDGVFFHSKSG